MEVLKYSVIKSKKQYFEYCDLLEGLLIADDKSMRDEIELLTVLIEKWDDDHNTFDELDPIELLKSLMKDHKLIAKDLGLILGLSKSTVSKILNYQKGLSKNSIRKLATYFKMSQEIFNRDYRHKMKIIKTKANLKKMVDKL